MGPLALSDLIGLDTFKAVAESMYEEFKEPLYSPRRCCSAWSMPDCSAARAGVASTTTPSIRLELTVVWSARPSGLEALSDED